MMMVAPKPGDHSLMHLEGGLRVPLRRPGFGRELHGTGDENHSRAACTAASARDAHLAAERLEM